MTSRQWTVRDSLSTIIQPYVDKVLDRELGRNPGADRAYIEKVMRDAAAEVERAVWDAVREKLGKRLFGDGGNE
jgi:hypothetical protein